MHHIFAHEMVPVVLTALVEDVIQSFVLHDTTTIIDPLYPNIFAVGGSCDPADDVKGLE